MGKRKSGFLVRHMSLIVSAAALAVGIIAFCMMFAEGVVTNVNKSFSGAQIAFGYTEKTDLGFIGSLNKKILGFNFLVFLGFLLPLLGGLTSFIPSKNIFIKLMPAALFLVGGIFIFLTGTFFPIAAKEGLKSALDNGLKVSLGAGAIAGGVLSIFGAGLTAAKALLVK